jgi:hypothetical protein
MILPANRAAQKKVFYRFWSNPFQPLLWSYGSLKFNKDSPPFRLGKTLNLNTVGLGPWFCGAVRKVFLFSLQPSYVRVVEKEIHIDRSGAVEKLI